MRCSTAASPAPTWRRLAPLRGPLAVALLAAAALAGTGCTSGGPFGGTCATPRCVTNFSEGLRNDHLAKQAWHARRGCYDGVQPCLCDFKKGFKAGYVAGINGQGECAPSLPPQSYWGPKFCTREGKCCVAAWHDGWAHGAVAAAQDGNGNLNEIVMRCPCGGCHADGVCPNAALPPNPNLPNYAGPLPGDPAYGLPVGIDPLRGPANFDIHPTRPLPPPESLRPRRRTRRDAADDDADDDIDDLPAPDLDDEDDEDDDLDLDLDLDMGDDEDGDAMPTDEDDVDLDDLRLNGDDEDEGVPAVWQPADEAAADAAVAELSVDLGEADGSAEADDFRVGFESDDEEGTFEVPNLIGPPSF